MDSTRDEVKRAEEMEGVLPVRDEDATATADASADAAQVEWDGADEERPAEALPVPEVQPETQGEDPVIAELGPAGNGDLSSEDA